ncbi:hypothetical protein BDQ17DRAFT_1340967 [Cyathus striatus]|nr:hypothetical protein BDQ17DRAFT_1340967 [Cyathus striatus]
MFCWLQCILTFSRPATTKTLFLIKTWNNKNVSANGLESWLQFSWYAIEFIYCMILYLKGSIGVRNGCCTSKHDI